MKVGRTFISHSDETIRDRAKSHGTNLEVHQIHCKKVLIYCVRTMSRLALRAARKETALLGPFQLNSFTVYFDKNDQRLFVRKFYAE